MPRKLRLSQGAVERDGGSVMEQLRSWEEPCKLNAFSDRGTPDVCRAGAWSCVGPLRVLLEKADGPDPFPVHRECSAAPSCPHRSCCVQTAQGDGPLQPICALYCVG